MTAYFVFTNFVTNLSRLFDAPISLWRRNFRERPDVHSAVQAGKCAVHGGPVLVVSQD